MNNDNHDFTQTQREKEWDEVEQLVLTYQSQFEENADSLVKKNAQDAAEELLKRFSPLFKKYFVLLQTGQIDYNDIETKLFVCSFIEDVRLQKSS